MTEAVIEDRYVRGLQENISLADPNHRRNCAAKASRRLAVGVGGRGCVTAREFRPPSSRIGRIHFALQFLQIAFEDHYLADMSVYLLIHSCQA